MVRSRYRPLAVAAILAATALLPAAAHANDVWKGPNPLAGKRQFIPCEFLSKPVSNAAWNPWWQVQHSGGHKKALFERIARAPTVYSFAGTPANKISKRMERYMTGVDHPLFGGPECRTSFSYSEREWNAGEPLAANASERRYVGGYPILAIRSLDYSGYKKGADPSSPYHPFIDNFVDELAKTYKARTDYRYHDVGPSIGGWIPYRQREAAVIVEPDYLALVGSSKGCRKSDAGASDIRYAVKKLTALPNIAVYLDIGEDNWLPVSTAACMLRKAGVADARGFVLNATHTGTTKANIRYGNKIAAKIKRHYVINTAENAHGKLARKYWFGPNCAPLPFGPAGVKGHRVPLCGKGFARNNAGGINTNCNPPNAGLGRHPTTHTASAWADAYLYVSRAGLSSNSGNRCRRGATSNVWWEPQALNEASRAKQGSLAWPPNPL